MSCIVVARSSLATIVPFFFALSADFATAAEAERQITFDAVYTGEVWRNASGGLAIGNRYLDNLDLIFDITEAAPGLRVFAYGLYNNGQVLNGELVGSAQGISNIESVEALRLYELWVDWQLPHTPLSLRFGLYDLNSEFDAIATASLFINPSHGIGVDFSQTGRFGPSIFPVTSLALRARAELDAWSIQGVVLDGVPGDPARPRRNAIDIDKEQGALVVAEVDYSGKSSTRVGLGHWLYTAKFDHLSATDQDGSPVQSDGNAGTYLFLDAPLQWWRGSESRLRGFARLGVADDEINPIEHYLGAGLVFAGAFGSTEDDSLGLAVGIAALGEHGRAARVANGESITDREYNIELTYRRRIGDWLALQADVQHVVQPNMDASLDAAWVFGLRFELSHRWSW